MGPPGVGKSHLAQALGYHAVKLGFAVLYRSIFDIVRDYSMRARGTGSASDGALPQA